MFSRPAHNLTAFLHKLIRYGLSSAVALAVDVGLLLILSQHFGIHYLLAAAIGFSAGCIVVWLLSNNFVFDDHSNRATNTNLGLFILVGVLGLGLNHVILYIGVNLFAIALILAKAISAILVFWFNFFLRGVLVFKDPDLSLTK